MTELPDMRRIAQQQAAQEALGIERRLRVAATLFGGMLATRNPMEQANRVTAYMHDLARLALIGADTLLQCSREDPSTWFEKPDHGEATTEPWDGMQGTCPECEENAAIVDTCTSAGCPVMKARGVHDLEGGDDGNSD